jgi:hypothetical protein
VPHSTSLRYLQLNTDLTLSSANVALALRSPANGHRHLGLEMKQLAWPMVYCGAEQAASRRRNQHYAQARIDPLYRRIK